MGNYLSDLDEGDYLEKYDPILFKGIKMVIFNLIGTVVDEGNMIYKTLIKTLEHFGIEYDESELNDLYGLGKSVSHILGFFNRKCGDNELNEVVNQFYTLLHTEYIDIESNVKPIEHSIELFDKLRNLGIIVCISSTYNNKLTESIIKKVEFDTHIDAFITIDEVEVGKPFPYMIFKLMEAYKIDSVDYIVNVGDTIGDLLEGINARVKYNVAVLSGVDTRDRLEMMHPDLIVDDVGELLNNKYY
jgi:phosphonatase-like hydrolase